MSKYFDEYDREILELMKNKDWWIDKFKARKIQLIKPSRRIHSGSSIPRKIGGLLLWQQVIEQFLKEIEKQPEQMAFIKRDYSSYINTNSPPICNSL